MRVLTVGNRYPPEGTGGYERVWAAAVAGLRAAGHDTTVLTTEGGEGAPGVHRELRWSWHEHAFVSLGLRATRALEAHNAAVLATHAREADLVVWFSMGGMGLSLVARAPVPQLAIVHDGWPLYGPRVDPWTARWGRWSRRRYDPARIAWWSCNSAFTRSALVRAGAIPDACSSVEPPGIDPAAFRASPPPAWRGELLVLGRVEARKGVADAIRALPDGMRLTVAGPAEAAHLAALQALAAGRAVTFTGPTDVPAGTLAAADAVLFPVTWKEPWGLVPLEAMAVGRPVVATGTGGSAEYLRPGMNALVVPPGDPAALRAAVLRLAAEPELRERLVAGGRATAAAHTQGAWVSRIVALAERVAGEAQAPAATVR